MKTIHLPGIGARYWALLILASVFGANTGDFLAERLGFGHVAGLPILLGCFLLVLAAERFDRAPRQIWFWLAVIVTRTAATNVGDIGHDLHWSGLAVIAGLALAGAVSLAAWRTIRRPPTQPLAAHPLYWWTMLVAGALGTAIGDWCSWGLGLGNLLAAGVLALPVALLLAALRGRHPVPLVGYWLTVVAIRAAGTAAGDFFANRVFGLELSTFVFGVAFGLALRALTVLSGRPSSTTPDVPPAH